MICKYCGADIQDGATFCASCGAAVEAGAASCEVPAEETVVYDATPVQAPSKTPMILGIVSMVCALITPIGNFICCCCGIPLWVGAIVTAIISFVQAKKHGQKKSGFAIAGLIISIAIVVLGAIGVILYIALYGFAAFAQILGSSGDYYY